MGATSSSKKPRTTFKSIFEIDVKKDGKDISLSSLKGAKAYLIVNTASNWGLAAKNYKELQILFERYNEKGLVILAFPCNDFGGQGILI